MILYVGIETSLGSIAEMMTCSEQLG